ncbi:MAG: hypothetical protein U1F43_18780 [Myxococcota bacterium]
MKRLQYLLVAPFFLIACGDDTGSGTDATNTTNGDTSTGDVAPGTSALTGVNTNVTKTNPNPTNANCDLSTAINNTSGAKYPWGGLTVSGRTYTCNGCPNGYAIAQGEYRAHGFSDSNGAACAAQGDDCTSDFSFPNPDTDLAEYFAFDGNTWKRQYHDVKGNKQATANGWYFCGMKPEGPQAHVVWYTLSASGDADIAAKDQIVESDVILGSENDIHIFWFDDVNAINGTTPGIAFDYCKIGTSDPNGVACDNPFK